MMRERETDALQTTFLLLYEGCNLYSHMVMAKNR